MLLTVSKIYCPVYYVGVTNLVLSGATQKMRNVALRDRTISALLHDMAAQKPSSPFLHQGDRNWTFAEVERSANRFANALLGLQVAPGEKLAIMMPNSPQWIFAWFGCARAGVVYVPINLDYKGQILEHQLKTADVSILLVDAQYLDRLADIVGRLPELKLIIIAGEEGERLQTPITQIPLTQMRSASDHDPNISVRHTDPHAIAFTSGTTGPSKGALATHCHVVTFAIDAARTTALTSEDRVYSSGMPLFHALASWLGVLPALIVGGQYMLAERFSASRFWEEVENFGATLALGVFTMPPILLKQPPRPGDADVPLRRFYLAQRNDEFEKRFNCRLLNTYGQTETGAVSFTPYGEEPRQGSCGRINTANFEVKIVDDDDNECPVGAAGEIVVRPRHPFAMMTEYYNMPAATAAAFRNLWFHTGDNGRLDEDDYLYFVDRKKDAMRRRGENVSSYEIESVVNTHPKILECAAIAVPSPIAEDDIKIVVVSKVGETLTPQDLWKYCDQNMPRFWVPRYIEFRSELPKTPTLKVQKYLLRDHSVGTEIFDREAHSP
jgi:carnitine-CoA ligase